MNQPQLNELAPWSQQYVSLVTGDVLETLERQATELPDFLASIRDRADFAYAPGKWTIKELTGHLIDTERIMVYRLTCFARKEQQVLPGFDEDPYVAAADFAHRDLADMANEFSALRKANMFLFKSFSEEELSRMGTSGQNRMSVRALIFVCAGHVTHHINVIKERYL